MFKANNFEGIVWKQPTEKDLGAPKEIALLIRESVFWNSEGKLDHAPNLIIMEYVISLLIANSLILLLISLFFDLIGINDSLKSIVVTFLGISLFLGSYYLFYIWGWKSYQEAWYHFNDKDELFTAIFKEGGSWETVEIPYEEVDYVEYIQSPNGKALIVSGQFEFETNRTREKRFSSVTELWPNLARFDVEMRNWPILLFCSVCKRSFGHHIGTAVCPWDNTALLDAKAKGRFDPEEQHVEDLDRI